MYGLELVMVFSIGIASLGRCLVRDSKQFIAWLFVFLLLVTPCFRLEDSYIMGRVSTRKAKETRQ